MDAAPAVVKDANFIKESDFVELEYTGKVTGTGHVFDTTSAEIAKENGLYDEHATYEPVVVCVGKRHVVIGLDKQLVGKEVGKTYTAKLLPEEAFGRKNAKLIQLISTAKFKQQNLTPFPGMQVNIDGIVGLVKTVTGGRTIVDFNHPLSGRELEYTFSAKRIVTELSEKVKAVLKLVGISVNAVKVSVADSTASIEFPEEVPEQLKKDLEEKLKSAIADLKTVSFTVKVANATAKDVNKEQKADIAAAAANGVTSQQSQQPRVP